MIRQIGDMWSIFDETDYFVVTTNSYIRNDGALVMGRGIARQLKDRFPKMPYAFADVIHHLEEYGVIIGNIATTDHNVGAFQVKYHYKDPADINLIRRSAEDLTRFANLHKDERIDMNFPGIGNGHLPFSDVLPIINKLPDNVHVWTFT